MSENKYIKRKNFFYDKKDNKIWKYNKSVSYPKNQERFILKTITLSTREFIIEHIMGQI